MIKKIGFIGMGIMGSRMAANLLDKGFEVTVFNRTKRKTAPLAEAGARIAACPRELAAHAEAVILMLTGPEAIDAALDGKKGLLAGLRPGTIVANMGTISPYETKELAGRVKDAGGVFVDAPVSGSKKPAEDGTLIVLAGGTKKALAAMKPAFLAMGKKIVHCGPAGSGTAMKMSVNLLLGVMLEGLAEALVLGRRQGLDPDLVLQTILDGPLACPLFAMKKDMLTSGTYPAQFPLTHMAKDMRFVVAAARGSGTLAPVAVAAARQYLLAEDKGLGKADAAAIRAFVDAPVA